MAKKKQREEQAAGFGEVQGRKRLTPVDVQEKVFRLSARFSRGYNEQDVDEFLDRITEELAVLHEENKRVREKLEEGGGGVGMSSDALRGAEQQAAEIVRQAREHAARLMAGAGEAAGAPPPPATFLVRERDFLQQMAALIQSHAEGLKADARRGKAEEASTPPRPVPLAEPEQTSPPPAPETGPASAPEGPTEGPPEWPNEPTQAHDPLLDEWEEDVAPKSGDYESSEMFGEAPEGEPESKDLRELFWGEDN